MLLSVMFSFKYFILLSMFDAQPGLPFCIHVVISFLKHFILKQLWIHRKLQREMYREVPCTLPPASPLLTSYTTIVQYHTEKFILVQSIEFIQISLVCMCMYAVSILCSFITYSFVSPLQQLKYSVVPSSQDSLLLPLYSYAHLSLPFS